MEMDLQDDLFDYEQYDTCPECGRVSFAYSEEAKHHVCVNEECGYVVDDKERKESVLTKILKALKLKK